MKFKIKLILLMLCSVTFYSCSTKTYSKDTYYCNDTLYLNQTNKPVNGKIYYLTESGSIQGYESYKHGISNGYFEEWGHKDEIINSGFNSPIDFENTNFNLREKYKSASLSEMNEGKFLTNIITLIKKDSSKNEMSVDSLKQILLDIVNKEMNKKCTKIDTIIFEFSKLDISCN